MIYKEFEILMQKVILETIKKYNLFVTKAEIGGINKIERK